jgi:glycine hydroxymethyltransferase
MPAGQGQSTFCARLLRVDGPPHAGRGGWSGSDRRRSLNRAVTTQDLHTSPLRSQDAEVADWLQREDRRQSTTLTLIASENHSSAAVRETGSSRLTDKYAEGYPSRRYYGGCEVADAVEDLARQRAMKLFAAPAANVQPHSGTTANLSALMALAGANGRIVGMSLKDGGHLSHGHPKSHTGMLFDPKQYGVNGDGLIDMDEVREVCRAHRPHVLIAGGSAYAREIDYAAFAEIAKECEAYLLADIAHPAGMIAAGVLPSPVGVADVVTMTTHKTLRGPRGGMILASEEVNKLINSSVFPGSQGGPIMQQIAGKAVAFGEALQPSFRDYQLKVKANAAHLAACLQGAGLKIVSGGTDNHIVLVDLQGTGVTGADVEERALVAGLSVNKNAVPNDPLPPMVTSGLRLGTPAVTTRGFGQAEIEAAANIVIGLVRGEAPESFRSVVHELCEAHPVP